MKLKQQLKMLSIEIVLDFEIIMNQNKTNKAYFLDLYFKLKENVYIHLLNTTWFSKFSSHFQLFLETSDKLTKF